MEPINPGPIDEGVLTLQSDHRSAAIWEGKECGPLTCRTHLKSPYIVDTLVTDYVSNTQFSGIQKLGFVPLNNDLITALVERWREETHTFHLPFGEVTITLQDVNVLFGLKVSGHPVTGHDYDLVDLLEEHLGIRPPREVIKGTRLKMTWLRENFQVVPRDENGDASDVDLHRYVRAYLLYLIGSVLFPDKTGNMVQLIFFPLLIDLNKIDEISWGSGVLACLYRNLCKASKRGVSQISGALLLLQLWSWERILIGRPTILGSMMPTVPQYKVDPLGCKWLGIDRSYNDGRLTLLVIRDLFDKMPESQFNWLPYTPDVLEWLSPICSEDTDEWLVIAPLICNEMVEWHLPNRCVRQFGWHQEVPIFCNTSVELHKVANRGETKKNYATFHKQYVDLWKNRKTPSKMVAPGRVYSGKMDHNDPYLLWYREITRLVISPPSAKASQNVNYEHQHCYYPIATDHEILTQMGVYNYNKSTELLKAMPNNVPQEFTDNIRAMQMMSLNSLQNTRQGHLVHHEGPRYNFRNLEHRDQGFSTQETQETQATQEINAPESSRPRKQKKTRKR